MKDINGLISHAKAAGVIPLTHKSGGPLKDIVISFEGQRTG
jgi:hypothetical protein